MTIRTRFAPSPTGRLHIGNARTALFNWLHAQHHGGIMVLRLDDTDAERSTEDNVVGIERDLTWLGLTWDERHRQSTRQALYDAAFQQLRARGRAYPCWETAEELARQRAGLRRRHLPPVYDRSALQLSEAARAELEATRGAPHWRFLLPDEEIVWVDAVQGEKRIHARTLSDPVLVRADGTPTYTFASSFDDLELGITDVIRGEDHVTNTAAQIALMRALDGDVPRFAHLPLLVDAAGKGLSKRLGSLSLESLREADLEPLALLNVLAQLGTGRALDLAGTHAALIKAFDLNDYGRAPPKFDLSQIERANADLVRALPFAAVADRLAQHGVDEALWLTVRGNVERVTDALAWQERLRRPLTPPQSDEAAFLDQAAASLPEGADEDELTAWLKALQAHTGRRGKALYQPLRLALTGEEHGPKLPPLIALMGTARARARLRGETA